MSQVHAIGSLNLDYVYKVPHFLRPGETLEAAHRAVHWGGKGLNQTVAMLRSGLAVRHCGAVGADGTPLSDFLAAEGSDVSHLRVDERSATGHTFIQVTPDGEPSILLRDRLDRALDYLEDHPDLTVVVSGGQGDNEPVTEARCMADYLMERGVEEDQLLLEERSHNTDQNLRYSRELLEAEGCDLSQGVVVVSNGFHLTRARMLAERAGYDSVSTLAAPSSHLPSRLHMYVREPLALVKSFVADR